MNGERNPFGWSLPPGATVNDIDPGDSAADDLLAELGAFDEDQDRDELPERFDGQS